MDLSRVNTQRITDIVVREIIRTILDHSLDTPVSLGMVGDEWHGPTPPSESNWVEIAPGPHGGKRWKHTGERSTADVRPEQQRGGGVQPGGTSSRGDIRTDGEGEGAAARGAGSTKEVGAGKVPETVREHLKPTTGSLKPSIVTARSEQTPDPDISKVPESLHKYLISPDGSTHQLRGTAMAISAIDKTGGFLLADGAGCGKTRPMLAIAQTYAMQGKKALIVAPAGIIKPEWESNSISGSVGKDGAAMGINLKLNRGDQEIKPGDVCVTTYESLKSIKDRVDENTVVIFDEAHGLKNATSARAKHGRDVATKAMGVVYGSATPADSVKDIAYLFRTKLFGDEPWEEARKKFSVKKSGALEVLSNVSEVFDKLTKDGIMVKREISLDGVEANFDHIQLPPELKRALDAMEREAPALRAQLLMRQRFAQERFKIPHTVEIANKELKEGRQVVIFVAGVGGGDSNKPGTAGMMREALAKSGISPDEIVELHGGEEGGGKEVVEAFQKGNAKVLITTAQSGGTGHNLDDTTGNSPRTQIIVTPPFSAIDNSQIWGRTHRLTTKSQSRMKYIFADTEVDKWNANLIRNKMATLNAIVGGESARQAIPDSEVSLGLIDGEWHGHNPPSWGTWVPTTPGPRGGVRWKRIKESGSGRSRRGNRGGREGDDRTPHTGSRGVEGATERPSVDRGNEDGDTPAKPTGAKADRDVKSAKAVAERMTKRWDAYRRYFKKHKYDEAAEWVTALQEHVDAVGVDVAMDELLPEKAGKGVRVQYKGTNRFLNLDKEGKDELKFIKTYLDHVGITFLPANSPRNKSRPLIASGPVPSATQSKQKGDIVAENTTLWSKLEEAQLIPGFESSEDIHTLMGRRVTRITPSVVSKLDETYGKDQWIIKNYGDESFATFGVLFPQRLRELRRNARQVISETSEKLEPLGYSPHRDNNVVTGISDNTGTVYKFDSQEYADLKDRELKRLCNLIIAVAPDENGARLPATSEDVLAQEYGVTLVKDKDGNTLGANSYDGSYVEKGTKEWKQLEEWYDEGSHHVLSRAMKVAKYGPDYGSELKYFVEPALQSSTVTEADRTKGLTWETGQEGRVHAVTRDGKVSIVPYATLPSRHDIIPVVFYDDETREMERTVQEALDKFPEKDRSGQTYGVDVMKTTDGWRVVETNPSVETEQSMWLQKNPFVIDAFVSHLTNREPGHVKFIRNVLRDQKPHRTGGISASIDVHGREHAPAGTDKGGQFVSKVQSQVTPSKAQIRLKTKSNWLTVWGQPSEKRATEAAEKFLGKGRSKQDFATIVAAPDDATVLIEVPENDNKVNIFVIHKDFDAERSIISGHDDDGKEMTWIYNKEMFVKPESQGKGLGSEIFLKQVNNASAIGIPAIYATAGAGLALDGSSMNGYYTLPILGYDVPLTTEHIKDKNLIRRIKRKFPDAETIQDVVMTEEGKQWWKENGDWIYDMEFDLSPGSRSMRVLDKYIAKRKSRSK